MAISYSERTEMFVVENCVFSNSVPSSNIASGTRNTQRLTGLHPLPTNNAALCFATPCPTESHSPTPIATLSQFLVQSSSADDSFAKIASIPIALSTQFVQSLFTRSASAACSRVRQPSGAFLSSSALALTALIASAHSDRSFDLNHSNFDFGVRDSDLFLSDGPISASRVSRACALLRFPRARLCTSRSSGRGGRRPERRQQLRSPPMRWPDGQLARAAAVCAAALGPFLRCLRGTQRRPSHSPGHLRTEHRPGRGPTQGRPRGCLRGRCAGTRGRVCDGEG
jgi:hypothetical protein